MAQPISLCATTCDHLELADSCHDNSMLDVDVLIVSDYYWAWQLEKYAVVRVVW